MTAKEKLEKKIKEMDVETIKEALTLLMNDFRNGTEVVFEKLLDELEKRIPVQDFIKFSETL